MENFTRMKDNYTYSPLLVPLRVEPSVKSTALYSERQLEKRCEVVENDVKIGAKMTQLVMRKAISV